MSDTSVDDQHYLEPCMEMSAKGEARNHDSGISSIGHINPSFLSTPDSEMDSSFSDEQKLSSSTKPYKASNKTDQMARRNTEGDKELGLPPPPGSMWLPVGQSHSADGVIGSYPPWVSNYPYVHPSMIHQAFHSSASLPQTGGLTAEEHQLLLKFRQEKKLKKSNIRESLSHDTEGGHLYEELPGYQYKTHQLGQSPSDGKAPPHLPPISSLPLGSQASGLDTLDRESLERMSHRSKKKENPLYEVSADRPPKPAESEQRVDQSSEKCRSRRTSRCHCALLLLVTLLATTALVIAILSAIGAINMTTSPVSSVDPVTGASIHKNFTNSSTEELAHYVSMLVVQVQNQSEVINKMNTKLLEVDARNTVLETQLNSLNNSLLTSSNENKYKTSALNASLLLINEDVTSLSLDIQQVNSSLRNAITNVSKMAGPPGETGPEGPPGYLEPTRCNYTFKQFNPDGPYNTTISTSLVNDTETVKVIAASCSWNHYEGASLKVVDLSASLKSYKCECTNAVRVKVLCRMEYWLCTV